MSHPNRPIAFVMAATNHGSMIVNRNDWMAVPGGGIGVGHQLLSVSGFDQWEVSLVLQLLQERRANFGDGVQMLDCGANIGVHTVECARFMHGWGSVLAFEAQERVFYALAGNIALNNCFNARAIWSAIGESEGVIGVPQPDYNKPASYGSLELREREKTEFIGQSIDYRDEALQTTRMVSIDSLGLARLDFLKIDIEGMEMDALNGGRNAIAAFKPNILIEKIKSDEGEIRQFLEALGYRLFLARNNFLAVHETDPALPKIPAGG